MAQPVLDQPFRELPWPEGWRPPGVSASAAGALVSYWVVFLLPLGWRLRDAAGATQAAYWGLVLAGHVLIGLSRRAPREDRVVARGGLVVPAAGSRAWLGIGGLGVACAAAVIALARTASGWRAAGFGAAFLGAVAVVLWLRPWTNELRLTTDGVRWAYGGRATRVAWEDVTAVEAYEARHEARGVTVRTPQVGIRAARASRSQRLPKPLRPQRVGIAIEVPVQTLDARPATTYWLVRFYAEHPEARAELADGRALDRVRRSDLLAPVP